MKLLSLATAAALLFTSAAFAQQGGMGGHFIENWDQDSDGAVTLAELAEKRENVFASFDSNEDGMLDAEEYALFDEARANDQAQIGGGHGKGKNGPETPMERSFNDTNADGMVSAEEWAAGSPLMFAKLDKNGDGKVTSDDFGKN